ncbi:MAG: hypothetical protein ABI947_16080 [Chloroflexota bacterium]
MRISFKWQQKWPAIFVLLMLWCAILACSSVDDAVGQRHDVATPTAVLFATATPGGRISISLITPTGPSIGPQAPTVTPYGQIVAPAASATAAFATLQAATATAGVTLSGPLYQPNDCPETGGPPPPPKPAAFSQFAEKIGVYLSGGGQPTVLEAVLRGWGALGDGAVVQADTDLTGDSIPEIIVTVYDPGFYKQGIPSPGELLIFGCAQKGYRLLYSTQYSPTTILPELKRVGDMNGDTRAEIAFTQQTCTGSGPCTQTMMILSWNATLGVFAPLNDVPINATNGKVTIADLDKDGILEVAITFTPVGDVAAGPPRKTTDIWDWNGQNYVLALTQVEAPVYRIHMLHDADVRFNQGNWKEAVKLFDRVRDDNSLQPWTIPGETETLRGYATYKKMLAYIAARSPRAADDVLTTLLAENPAGTPAQSYAVLGQAFMDSYKQTRDRKKTCAATLAVAASHPDLLTVLNSYGYANRTYALQDLCPFVDK